jgi:hypothetical protein
MRTFGLLGVLGALILTGAVAMAASPSPSPAVSASPRPSATPHASATPRASAAPKASASPASSALSAPSANQWQATIQPLNVAGKASVRKLANGIGVIDLRLTGLVNEQPWTVDVDGGTAARPAENMEVAFKAGSDVQRISADTIRIHLSRTEMATFMKAQRKEGVVILVSDGTRLSAAEIAQ